MSAAMICRDCRDGVCVKGCHAPADTTWSIYPAERREAQLSAMTPDQRVTYLEDIILAWVAAPSTGFAHPAAHMRGEAARIGALRGGKPLYTSKMRFA